MTIEKFTNSLIVIALTVFTLLGVEIIAIIHYLPVPTHALALLTVLMVLWTGSMVYLVRLARHDWISL